MDAESMAREMLETLGQLFRGPIRGVQALSGGELGMMIFLMMHKAPAAPTEISQFFGITSARVTNALNSLEKKGYVLRRPVPGDRRRVLADITESGRDMVMSKVDVLLRNVIQLMDALGEEDAKEFLRLIKRVVQLSNDGVVVPPFAALNTTGGMEE